MNQLNTIPGSSPNSMRKPFTTGLSRGPNGQLKGMGSLISNMENNSGLGIIRERTPRMRGNQSSRSGGSSKERSMEKRVSQTISAQRKLDRERTLNTLGRYEEVDPDEYQRQ